MTNLYIPQYAEEIELAAGQLLDDLTRYRETHDHDVPADIDICLCKTWSSDGDDAVGYYMASMSEQTIFWLNDVCVNMVTDYERVVVSESHLGVFLQLSVDCSHLGRCIELAVKKQFWYEYF